MPVDLMSVRHFLLAVFGRQEVGAFGGWRGAAHERFLAICAGGGKTLLRHVLEEMRQFGDEARPVKSEF